MCNYLVLRFGDSPLKVKLTLKTFSSSLRFTTENIMTNGTNVTTNDLIPIKHIRHNPIGYMKIRNANCWFVNVKLKLPFCRIVERQHFKLWSVIILSRFIFAWLISFRFFLRLISDIDASKYVYSGWLNVMTVKSAINIMSFIVLSHGHNGWFMYILSVIFAKCNWQRDAFSLCEKRKLILSWTYEPYRTWFFLQNY